MKRITYILCLFLLAFMQSCKEPERIAGFEDAEQFSIYDYLMLEENKAKFSSFIAILEAGSIDKTLSAYNPDGIGYTLFLPDNEAINAFISSNEQISSLNDIINNLEYARAFSRYHVVNRGIHTNDFPFGAFPEPTLSGDFLTVNFVIEPDTSYYKINNQAAVSFPNIEVSNGYVHLVKTALKPITFTSYEWLSLNAGFSIFKEAVDLTGLQSLIDINIKEIENTQPVTVLLESNAVFGKSGIGSISDLIKIVSPNDDSYNSVNNPLYNFVGYHILNGGLFIDDFEGVSTNYTTFSDIPLNINGVGLDLAINKGKQVFDTIIVQNDTTFIDYIGFLYDESNVLTNSGAIHFIDRVLTQKQPSRAIKTFEFWEEPYITTLRREVGTYLIEDKELLNYVEWSGADLTFVELGDQQSSAWGNDYFEINGDFIISYQIPKIIQGKYDVFLGADAFNSQNALVEVYIDGKKIGGLVDLSKGGSSNSPFQRVELGTIDFKRYSSHNVEIRSLIPGRFLWDYIRFEPI